MHECIKKKYFEPYLFKRIFIINLDLYRMRKLFQENSVYIICYLLVVSTALIFKLFYTKEEIFLYINSKHSAIGDALFPYITHLGDGIFIILCTILLLWYSYRYALLSLLIYTISSQLVQVLKRVFFSDFQRPSKYFENIADLHLVEGVKLHQMMSFPSGHTTSAFAFMTFLAIITKNKTLGAVYLILASIVSFSRIYLSQHFLEDTLAGSLIGVLSAFIITYVLQKYSWYNSPWLDQSLAKKKQ